MKKLDRYLLSSFLGPFILTFVLVLFILVMQFLWMYIDELVGKGLSFGVIMEFLGWGAATLLPMTLPLATLLASIMTLGNLGEHNELLAMKSAGISLGRILSPLIVVSGVICIGAFFISNDLIPVAYKNIYALRDDIGKTKEEIKIPTGTFYDGIDNYILRVDSRDDETGMMSGIMIYDHTNNKGNTSLTLADSGSIKFTPDNKNMVFTLYNGQSYDETNSFTYRDTTLDQNIITFKEQQIIIPLENYAFSRSEEGERFGNEIMAKDLATLRSDHDTLSKEFDNVRPGLLKRFLIHTSLSFISQMDTAVTKKELGQFPYDSLLSVVDENRMITYYREALPKVEEHLGSITTYDRETYRYVDPMRKMEIESFRKFTLSLACLIFFFIGAPLGAIIRKGGLGTPVIISVLFFILYWVFDITGKKLARDGVMSPFSGTFISTAVLLPIGVFLTYKATTDSALFNKDIWKMIFGKVWKFVSAPFKHKTRIVFMGTPEFAVGPLKALMDADFEIAAVVTVPDKQSGRGLKVNQSAVKKFAVERGLPVLQPESLKDEEFIASLQQLKADMFVVVAFRMLPKVVWSMPRLGTFNLHASLLPQYRGAAPINWALINGERMTGVTTFFIDEQIDTGKIIFSESYMIENYDNAGTLHDTLCKLGSTLTVKTAKAIARRKVKPTEQFVHGEIKPAPKLTKELCHIDWNNNAYEINNLIRGLSPYPAAFANLTNGETVTGVKIFEAYICEDDVVFEPGTTTTDGKSYLSVSCKDYALRLLDIQVAGKKRLEIKEFLKGFREPEKYRFV